MSDSRGAMRSKEEQLANDALVMTKVFINKLWTWQRDTCFAMLAENCTCIYPNDRYPRTREQFINDLTPEPPDEMPLIVSSMELEAAVCEWPLCLVTGTHLLSTDVASGQISAQIHRVSYLWEATENGLRIVHIHVSNVMERKEGERFYSMFGRENYAYVQAVLDHERKSRLISFRDTSGDVHWVMPEDVVYVAAHRQYTDVQCVGQRFVLRRGIGSICNARKGLLVRVHRSYAVNPMHLKTMEGNVLHLDDGTDIEVPRKRLAQVRRELMILESE